MIWITASSVLFRYSDYKHERILHPHQPQTRRRGAGSLHRFSADRGAPDGGRQSRCRDLGNVDRNTGYMDSLRDTPRRLLDSFVAPHYFPWMDGKKLFRGLHDQRDLRAAAHRCRRPGVSCRALHSSDHAGERGFGRVSDRSHALAISLGRFLVNILRIRRRKFVTSPLRREMDVLNQSRPRLIVGAPGPAANLRRLLDA